MSKFRLFSSLNTSLSTALRASLCALLLLCSANGVMAQENDARIRSQADLQNYLDHFNNRRYEQQIAYYAPDVAYSVGSLDLTSPEQIAEFYNDFHDYVNEHVEIAAFAITGDTVAVVMPTSFEAYRDYNKNGLNFSTGTTIEVVSFIFYELKDGKIHRIRIASYSGSAEDFID